jgi:hypothetical protein
VNEKKLLVTLTGEIFHPTSGQAGVARSTGHVKYPRTGGETHLLAQDLTHDELAHPDQVEVSGRPNSPLAVADAGNLAHRLPPSMSLERLHGYRHRSALVGWPLQLSTSRLLAVRITVIKRTNLSGHSLFVRTPIIIG